MIPNNLQHSSESFHLDFDKLERLTGNYFGVNNAGKYLITTAVHWSISCTTFSIIWMQAGKVLCPAIDICKCTSKCS